MTYLDPSVWGPHYWFFLHTIAMTYPLYPNSITKKKYYDFIQNLPLFIPVEDISSKFTRMLNRYPISPYLDNRESLVTWMHFVHNKINEELEKPTITLEQFKQDYENAYKRADVALAEHARWKHRGLYALVMIAIAGGIYVGLRK